MSGIIIDTVKQEANKQARYKNTCLHGAYSLMGNKNKQDK